MGRGYWCPDWRGGCSSLQAAQMWTADNEEIPRKYLQEGAGGFCREVVYSREMTQGATVEGTESQQGQDRKVKAKGSPPCPSSI